MKKIIICSALCLATLFSAAQAQTKKQNTKARNEAVLVTRKATVAEDKATLTTLRDQKEYDKVNEDKPAVQADRKALRTGKKKLLKDQVKKDVSKVKAKI
ncbi:hypothetical protein [Fibrivirga algicola]|uniref:Uncharacterized protein n=1 Tax=Fibrivirga algicola TaxID=2950420 RepID=A0ABX0QTH2_9BACT|nr:hypothetical protein [Fibrivirga algicola]NID13484.1 hypothetical protein [Fibrivirga algicola]